MNRMYRHRDFELVTISADSPEENDKALEVLKKKQVSATNYLFEGNDKYKLMDAVDEKSSGAVPHTILVAPGGKILYRSLGPVRSAGGQESGSWATTLGRTLLQVRHPLRRQRSSGQAAGCRQGLPRNPAPTSCQ